MGKSVELFIGNEKIETTSLSYKIQSNKINAVLYLKRKGKYYFNSHFGIFILSDNVQLNELKYGDNIEILISI